MSKRRRGSREYRNSFESLETRVLFDAVTGAVLYNAALTLGATTQTSLTLINTNATLTIGNGNVSPGGTPVMPVPDNHGDLIYDATRSRVYVVRPAGVDIYVPVAGSVGPTGIVIGSFLNQTTGTMTVGTALAGGDISADGSKLYLTESGSNTLHIVELATGAVTDMLMPADVAGGRWAAALSDGTVVIEGVSAGSQAVYYSFDPSAATFTAMPGIAGGYLFRNANHTAAAVESTTGTTVFTPGNAPATFAKALHASPVNAALSPDGTMLALPDIYYGTNNTTSNIVVTNRAGDTLATLSGIGAVFDPVRPYLYVLGLSTVTAYSTVDFHPVGQPIGVLNYGANVTNDVGLVRIADDGSYLFFNSATGTQQINLEQVMNRVTATVAIQGSGQAFLGELVEAGEPATFTVTLTHWDGTAATDYRGTVHFAVRAGLQTVSGWLATTGGAVDPFAALPADYTFTAADAGTHTFSLTNYSAGTQFLWATDAASGFPLGDEQFVTFKITRPVTLEATQHAGYVEFVVKVDTTGLPAGFVPTKPATFNAGLGTTDAFDANGVARLRVTVPPGDYYFNAALSGTDDDFNPTAGKLFFTVVPHTVTVTGTPPANAVALASQSITAQVTDDQNVAVQVGGVRLRDAATGEIASDIVALDANGRASIALSHASGTYRYTIEYVPGSSAQYAGVNAGTYYSAATSGVVEYTVTRAVPTVTTSRGGATFTNNTTIVPTGTVTWKVNGRAIGTSRVVQGGGGAIVQPFNWQTLSNATLTPNGFTPTNLTGVYSGDQNYQSVTFTPWQFLGVVGGPPPAKATGSFDRVSSVEVTGWAYDPKITDASVIVRIAIDGVTRATFAAEDLRLDVAALMGHGYHGFKWAMPKLVPGNHTVQVFVLDAATGAAVSLGSKTVTAPAVLFDEAYYLATNPDIAAAVKSGGIASGWVHFSLYGQYEGRNPSAFFNKAYYLAQNPDVAAAVAKGTIKSAYQHFELYGQREGRKASVNFSETYYLSKNPDIAAAVAKGILHSGLEHYLLYGQFEGRRALP